MTKELRQSFKRVNLIHKLFETKEDETLKVQFIYIVLKLLNEGARLIFMDEFAIDRKVRKKYSWSVKGAEINI